MARTGYLIVIYQDVNPSSPTYNQTREERTQDEENCPTSAEAHWIEDTKYCELTENGMLTGYEITVYRDVEPLSSTYNQTREERELNLEECEADSSLPNWQNIGEPFCRQTVYMPGGLMGNDGYMVQQQQDMNEYSPTADEIRDVETLDLENCPLPNTEPVWQIISESCHLVMYQGELVYDGTKDVIRVNTNQYSSTWNNNIPETVNIEDEINCPSVIPTDFSTMYLTFEAIEDGTFTFTGRNSNSLSYSIDDGQTWTALASGTASPTVTSGNKIMWKGITTPDSGGIGIFSSTGTFNAYGNTMSIVHGDNFRNSTTISDYQFKSLFDSSKVVNAENLVLPATILRERCYLGMFKDCNSLTTTPQLPATTLASYCYGSMFNGCRNLRIPPELPATTLADHCYYAMFADCSRLGVAPQLPATTLADYCYAQMFYRCSALKASPILPATTLADYCYQEMFLGCGAMDIAPSLPATTLAEHCYDSMFYHCTNLTIAPELPATTLTEYCYYGMFSWCTYLTEAPQLPATTLAEHCYDSMFSYSNLSTAPELPATTLTVSCYKGMFKDCTNLVIAPELPATTLAEHCYDSMFYHCMGLTKPTALPATTLADYCYYAMFSACTDLLVTPELPATTLANNCYTQMFYGCSALKASPILPATTLTNNCYEQMFKDCTSLNYIICLATDISATNCTHEWVKNVASSGTFVKAANMSSWTTGVDGIPTGWTVETPSA